MKRRCRDPLDRFMEKVSVEPNSGCWLWTASVSPSGYAKFGITRSVSVEAHAWAYRRFRGDVPRGWDVHHKCEVKCCVNPNHLQAIEKATHREITDTPCSRNKKKSHCLNGHPFDEKNTHYDKNGGRSCRACHSIRQNSARAKRLGGPLPWSPRKPKTHCSKGHPLSPENTYEYHLASGNYKRCKVCWRACVNERAKAARKTAAHAQ
jgi:hypothetical protein